MAVKPNMVSIVIPTYDGREYLSRLLPVLFSQKVDYPFEVICVDSSSQDGTWELLEQFPVTRRRISSEVFNHGGTRNDGIAMSRGEVIILITQDALPVGDKWMSTLVRNFASPDVAGVYCRQVPREDGPLLPKVDLKLWVSGMEIRRENQISDHPNYDTYSSQNRRLLCNFDNICSAVRRSVWERFPLNLVNYAEDLDWGKRVFEAGYKLIFEPEAKVVHSHDRSFRYEFKRSFITADTEDRLFGGGGEDKQFSLFRALYGVINIPRWLRSVYPEICEIPFSQRFRAYYILSARTLGRSAFSIWRRRLQNYRLREMVQRSMYRGI
jgi:rhamnosyltransferase